jgi:hypothetical protein
MYAGCVMAPTTSQTWRGQHGLDCRTMIPRDPLRWRQSTGMIAPHHPSPRVSAPIPHLDGESRDLDLGRARVALVLLILTLILDA